MLAIISKARQTCGMLKWGPWCLINRISLYKPKIIIARAYPPRSTRKITVTVTEPDSINQGLPRNTFRNYFWSWLTCVTNPDLENLKHCILFPNRNFYRFQKILFTFRSHMNFNFCAFEQFLVNSVKFPDANFGYRELNLRHIFASPKAKILARHGYNNGKY